jgi:hypothetical protein
MRIEDAYRYLSIACGVIAAVSGFFLIRLGWQRSGDLDVTGFVWMTTNFGALTLLFCTVFFGGLSLWYWTRSKGLR